jgi:NADPH:quinone reductase-like Zn-dependent oxidoreductase
VSDGSFGGRVKAIVYHRYGSPDVLECEEIEKPTPADDEVLIKVRAASVNPLDRHLMRGRPYVLRIVFGLRRPPRPGRDVAGQVEAVGKNVTKFRPGDDVFGACRGAFAEYACAPERALVIKPTSVTFEQAASAPVAGLTALQGLRDRGRIQPGQRVLINGAAGGVGTFAVQIARWLGADVTGVCSTRNVDMVRSIGADRVIDYTREDFTRGGQLYDLIFDCVGNHSPSACRRALKPAGICVMVGGPTRLRIVLAHALEALVLSRFGRRRLVPFLARIRREDLTILGDLMEAGTVKPVIDRRYRLTEVPQAIRYLEDGHVRGKLVINLEQGSGA